MKTEKDLSIANLICPVCQKPINPGEKYDTINKKPAHQENCYDEGMKQIIAKAIDDAKEEIIIIIPNKDSPFFIKDGWKFIVEKLKEKAAKQMST